MRVAALVLLLLLLLPGLAAPARGDGVMLVDRGPVTLGSNHDAPDEAPGHRVWLEQFYIDLVKVTNAEFAAFLEARGLFSPEGESYLDADDPDARIRRRRDPDGRERWSAYPGWERHPVVEVSWLGARDYCAWRRMRLPTEAEWEKAARGSDARRYPWGDAPPTEEHAVHGQPYGATEPVGGRPLGASPHGVLGMVGNLREWTASQYRPYPYRRDDGREDSDPTAARVVRGASHDDPASDLRVTIRRHYQRGGLARGHHHVGFRCATSEDLGGY